MKASHFILRAPLMLILFLSLNTFAQNDPKNTLKTNPFVMFNGQIPHTNEYRLVYERSLTNHLAFQLGGAYNDGNERNFSKITDAEGASIAAHGFRVQPSFKFYLRNQPSPRGMYLSPMYSYNTATFQNEGNPEDFLKATYTSMNLLAGWQVMIKKTLVVDVFGGIGRKHNYWTTGDAERTIFDVPNESKGMKLNLGFNMGFAF